VPDYQVSTTFTAHDKMSGSIDKMGRSVHKYGKDAEQAFDKAARAAKRSENAQRNLGKIGSGLKTGTVAAGVGIVAGGVGMASIIKNMTELATGIDDVAAATGISAKALQEYQYVAQLSGSDVEDMTAALQKLTIGLGKGTANEALGALGLTIEQVSATNPDKRLELIADAMRGIGDPTLKAAAATALFGKSNIRMVNALSTGSEGIQKLRDEAQKTGFVMSDSLIKAAGDFDDQMHRMNANLQGVTNQLGMKLYPTLIKIGAGITDFISKNKEAIASGVDKFFDRLISIGEKLAPVFKFVGKVLEGVGEIFDFLGPVFETIGEIFAELAPVIDPIIDLVKKLAAAVGKLLVNAFNFLKPIINTFINIFNSIGPLISKIIDKVGTFIGAILKALGPALEKIMPILEKVFVEIFKAAEPIISTILDVFTELAPAIGVVADVIASVLGPALDIILPIIKSVLGFISDLIKGVKDVLEFLGILKKEQIKVGSAADYINYDPAESSGGFAAPNTRSADARQGNINFQGQLNISGVPAGSTVKSTTIGAPPVKTNLMGAPAR
jgi:phage-related protein